MNLYLSQPNFYAGLYRGLYGSLGAAVAEFLAAALGNKINAQEDAGILCEDPRAVLRPSLPANEEVKAPFAISVRGKPLNNTFTA